MNFDPTKIRLSNHFLLSDFLGNHSVYSKGLINLLRDDDSALPLKMANGTALCEHILEPLLEQAGPMSISYGYITPDTSDDIVTYQDPQKPSHHRWDLGAAADVCIHEWINADAADDTKLTAPVALAHEIYASEYPYSRLITYSESPYLCIAVSAAEIKAAKPRHAFYENRYCGVAKAKPDYKSYPSASSKYRESERFRSAPMEHGWRGAGYPTYHGGGRRQYQHHRVSKYTMLSDWLFDLQSIAKGYKNIPALNNPNAMDSFARAGNVYDYLIQETKINRFSIIEAYLGAAHPNRDQRANWNRGEVEFVLAIPGEMAMEKFLNTTTIYNFPDIKTIVPTSHNTVRIILE